MFRVLALILLASCTTPLPDYGIPAQYPAELKPQLPFSVDGVSYQGVATVQRKSSSKIAFVLPEKTELVVLSTCARQLEFWKPSGKSFEYIFIPAMYVENIGSCPMSFIAVTGTGEWHRALIDFSNAPKDPLKVDVQCNGVWKTVGIGADICSVREGLPVRVWPVDGAIMAKDPNSDCDSPRKVIGDLSWEINVKKGFCVYVMLTKDAEFRLTTYGYTSFLRVYPPERK